MADTDQLTELETEAKGIVQAVKKFVANVKHVFTNIDWANISIGTYTRYVLLLLGVLNFVLNIFGVNPIQFDEGTVGEYVEYIYYIVVLIINTYKDNPTSPEAIESNKYMKELKAQNASGSSTASSESEEE